jgi:polar amino acid transport system permease protein
VTLQYGQVLQYLPDFLLGAAMALWIAALAFAGGLLIGLAGAAVLTQAPRWLRVPVLGYVRCLNSG